MANFYFPQFVSNEHSFNNSNQLSWFVCNQHGTVGCFDGNCPLCLHLDAVTVQCGGCGTLCTIEKRNQPFFNCKNCSARREQPHEPDLFSQLIQYKVMSNLFGSQGHSASKSKSKQSAHVPLTFKNLHKNDKGADYPLPNVRARDLYSKCTNCGSPDNLHRGHCYGSDGTERWVCICAKCNNPSNYGTMEYRHNDYVVGQTLFSKRR